MVVILSNVLALVSNHRAALDVAAAFCFQIERQWRAASEADRVGVKLMSGSLQFSYFRPAFLPTERRVALGRPSSADAPPLWTAL